MIELFGTLYFYSRKNEITEFVCEKIGQYNWISIKTKCIEDGSDLFILKSKTYKFGDDYFNDIREFLDFFYDLGLRAYLTRSEGLESNFVLTTVGEGFSDVIPFEILSKITLLGLNLEINPEPYMRNYLTWSLHS